MYTCVHRCWCAVIIASHLVNKSSAHLPAARAFHGIKSITAFARQGHLRCHVICIRVSSALPCHVAFIMPFALSCYLRYCVVSHLHCHVISALPCELHCCSVICTAAPLLIDLDCRAVSCILYLRCPLPSLHEHVSPCMPCMSVTLLYVAYVGVRRTPGSAFGAASQNSGLHVVAHAAAGNTN